MSISGLSHVAIRTADLDASERFYSGVLGLRAGYRPPFTFAGRWLYPDTDECAGAIIHLIGSDDPTVVRLYTGSSASERGTGAVDHVAFAATGWSTTRERLENMGIAYLDRLASRSRQRQVFLNDPSGITIELNFAGG